MDECFFKCGLKNKKFSVCGSARIRTIIKSSIERRDDIHCDLQRRLDNDCDLTINCHRNCVSTYTSTTMIKRFLKSRLDVDATQSYMDSPPRKRTCRSELPVFTFREHCIFCGELCVMEKEWKHPDRWRKAVLCRTAERGAAKTFKDTLLGVCLQRADDWGRQVQVRLSGAVSDLHAADGRYHKDCYLNFISKRSVAAAANTNETVPVTVDSAFETLVEQMKVDDTNMWTSADLLRIYQENGGALLSRQLLVEKLCNFFGRNLIVLSSSGLANILIFRSRASQLLRVVNEDDDDMSVNTVAKHIFKETQSIKLDKATYKSRINSATASEDISATLLSLLSKISDNLRNSLPALLIGNMVTSAIQKHPTGLQVALGVLLRKKSQLELFNAYGVTCTYKEVLRFKSSAALATVKERSCTGVFKSSNGLIQAVADNFDANISSQNGLKSTHGLAMLFTQPKPNNDIEREDQTFRRIKQKEMKTAVTSNIPVHVYTGAKKPSMPENECKRCVRLLKILAEQNILSRRAKSLDFAFFKSISDNPSTPEFGGFNTKLAREHCQAIKTATNTVYTPLIDMKPSDATTMMTAMMEAQRITKESGKTFTVFTADQQLYRVMINILWVHPELFPQFVPRLGGMHMLMSFVGSIGMLMSNSGLEDIMKAAFGGVSSMLTGKNFPQNTRALRLVVETVLHDVVQQCTSHDDLMIVLDGLASTSKTTKLWVDCLIKPVLIMMLFVRAEREGDWSLHLLSVAAMMPYFFSAGHVNYARYGLYYLRSMERLPSDVLLRFLEGEHVMRHKPGLWNGLWSDMYIESTFMRYGHGPGGIIGITLNPQALKRWALSLHICSVITKDMSDMKDMYAYSDEVTCHKEEMPARIAQDLKDRRAIYERLQTCIDPLNSGDHPISLVNIATGQFAPESVNVHDAISFGTKQWNDYECHLPDGFHSSISKVVTMADRKKAEAMGSGISYDTELIYSRVIGLMPSRDLQIRDIFKHELASVPPSMFDDSGNMRITKSKSVLKQKLQVEHSARNSPAPHVVVVDGCALLWIIHWPVNGTLQDFVDGFIMYIMKILTQHDVYVVFDRYFQYSIKSVTRSGRAAKSATRQHKLNPTMPIQPQKVILTVTENKVQLIDIICEQLLNKVQHVHPTVSSYNSRLIVTGKDSIPQQICSGIRQAREDMKTSHEEADVIIPQQVVYAFNEGAMCIKVISDDTDVFALLTHYYISEDMTCQLLMESTTTIRKVVDIGETARKHHQIIPHLLAAHALSGCDTVAYMFGIGKATVLKLLFKGHTLLKLGDIESDLNSVVKEATSFMAACYGCPDAGNMSDTRYAQWLSRTGKRKATIAPKLKSLPPTSEAFEENVKRAHIQTCIWKNALLRDPPNLDPTKFGWQKDDVNKTLIPITLPVGVDVAPPEILQMIRCGCGSDEPCSSGRCGCFRAQLPCTIFCQCYETENCQNPLTKINVLVDEVDVESDSGSDVESEID